MFRVWPFRQGVWPFGRFGSSGSFSCGASPFDFGRSQNSRAVVVTTSISECTNHAEPLCLGWADEGRQSKFLHRSGPGPWYEQGPLRVHMPFPVGSRMDVEDHDGTRVAGWVTPQGVASVLMVVFLSTRGQTQGCAATASHLPARACGKHGVTPSQV